MGKEPKKEWSYMCVCMCIHIYIYLIHFAVQQKLTQHCKSTIPHYTPIKITF